MKSFTRKSIISTLLIGSVVTGAAFTAFPFIPSMTPVASAASSSFTQFYMITHQAAPLKQAAAVSQL